MITVYNISYLSNHRHKVQKKKCQFHPACLSEVNIRENIINNTSTCSPHDKQCYKDAVSGHIQAAVSPLIVLPVDAQWGPCVDTMSHSANC